MLICPGCQESRDWATELDRCIVCDSVRLLRRLGEVECHDCGAVAESGSGSRERGGGGGGGGGVEPDGAVVGLAEEVEQALGRVLHRAGRSIS